jgi:putative flippase GtrA
MAASSKETSSTGVRGSLKQQISFFAAIGVFGYLIDASVTYVLARDFRVDPLIARLPAFAIATIVNFGLNRALTFTDSTMPLVAAFVRYTMVCAAGLVVNYSAYVSAILIAEFLGFAVTPSALPIFVGCGTGVAMFVTFFGFRFFVFRT